MENRYVTGSIVAVLLTAMVFVSAGSGLQASNHFLASAGQRSGVFGAREEAAVATGNLNVSVTWCSDWTARYCIPISGVSVVITNQTGSAVASSLTNKAGRVQFAVASPATYTVTVGMSDDSAFGFSYVNEYQVVQTSAGNTTSAPFVYLPDPILGW